MRGGSNLPYRFVKLLMTVPPQLVPAIKWYVRYMPNHMTANPTHHSAHGYLVYSSLDSFIYRLLFLLANSYSINSSSYAAPSYPRGPSRLAEPGLEEPLLGGLTSPGVTTCFDKSYSRFAFASSYSLAILRRLELFIVFA